MEAPKLKTTTALLVGCCLDLIFTCINSFGFGYLLVLLYTIGVYSDISAGIFEHYFDTELESAMEIVRVPLVLIGICLILHVLNFIPIVSLFRMSCCQKKTSTGGWLYKVLLFWQYFGIAQQLYLLLLCVLGAILRSSLLVFMTKVWAPIVIPLFISAAIRFVIVCGFVIMIRYLKNEQSKVVLVV